jgi:hypothetical protein
MAIRVLSTGVLTNGLSLPLPGLSDWWPCATRTRLMGCTHSRGVSDGLHGPHWLSSIAVKSEKQSADAILDTSLTSQAIHFVDCEIARWKVPPAIPPLPAPVARDPLVRSGARGDDRPGAGVTGGAGGQIIQPPALPLQLLYGVPEEHRAVAVQVPFERHSLKPGFHLIGARVETT